MSSIKAGFERGPRSAYDGLRRTRLKIGGSILGNANVPAFIKVGSSPLAPGANVLKSLTVAGGIEHASILAGYDANLAPKTSDIRVGAITAGSWTASNLAVGIAAAGDAFGIVAQKIGALKIGTTAVGFTAANNEVFQIGATGDFIVRELP